MSISIFDLFSIGIGPSSSHTVGPMKAAYEFIKDLHNHSRLREVARIKIELFGSLAFTGKGHGTDKAILLGLQGALPDTVEPDVITPIALQIVNDECLDLFGLNKIVFKYQNDFIYNTKNLLPYHTNGMRFSVFNQHEAEIGAKIFYSIGGGFILSEDQITNLKALEGPEFPYPFFSAKTLIKFCEDNHLSIRELMFQNELSLRSSTEIEDGLLKIAQVMRDSIDKGCQTTGILPGGLNVKRRAPHLYQKMISKGKPSYEHMDSMAWLNLYAIAVNEENAAGGRVVTAPTNGAAGIIPAVLHYYLSFYPQAKSSDAVDFLLVAGAIGILYKKGASISGAEVGCQGEVGVACSMAAGALTAILGGSLYQIENAAEIAMEHHLGLTCDPINGLVQIPCIERNAMGAVKAVNAARLALLGDGEHYVSLDKVIATMKQTGKDMMAIYKETSLGGLAANLPEC